MGVCMMCIIHKSGMRLKCQDESSAHVIGILPQVRDHVNSIEVVQAAPSQVLYSPSLYTQHQPRGFMREVHIIMLMRMQYACACHVHVIAILPQVREHVNSIEDVQAAPSQVLYSPSLYTQHQPRGIMREVHVIMLPGDWDAKRRNANYPGRRNRMFAHVCACA